ncbi:hypothetical protein [Shinella zoogloeoides]|uniref:hypothetical protein n=1 Tax=Shinella zoogloeoides TaxID=352475 RepID=UPI00273DF4EA|nr:hypothetical protein [Shinella zoogloeoides]WLR90897.1 hypothetical protein Q9316_00540 [Shinella zoogloeoides]
MSSKDQMFAKVILASKPTNGAPPIITIHARYPRFIHAEVMTHRVFSRNARSSRAVPVAKMLEEIRTSPVVPWHWGANQKGMQAGEPLPEELEYILDGNVICKEPREAWWLRARNDAMAYAERYMRAGAHKQIANRLLEPFMWIDTLITSTSWANFLHLRDHDDAEPHFHDLAAMFREAISGAGYQTLEPGQWHLPYVDRETWDQLEAYRLGAAHLERKWINKKGSSLKAALALEVSTARCARISYSPFDGDSSIEKELIRHDLLVRSSPLHASPAEHQATPDQRFVNAEGYATTGLAGNLGPGWIQYRKTLPGECIKDSAA